MFFRPSFLLPTLILFHSTASLSFALDDTKNSSSAEIEMPELFGFTAETEHAFIEPTLETTGMSAETEMEFPDTSHFSEQMTDKIAGTNVEDLCAQIIKNVSNYDEADFVGPRDSQSPKTDAIVTYNTLDQEKGVCAVSLRFSLTTP